MGLFRLYLAVCVFNAHAGYFIPPGWFPDATMAVRAFYVLSGFYMALVLNEKYGAATGRFYAARALRLYPLYLIVLAVSVALQLAGEFGTVKDMWNGSRTYATASWDLALAGIMNDVLMFPGAVLAAVFHQALRPPFTTEMLIAPCFTVGVELIFYAIAPFIVRRRLPIVGAWFAVGAFFYVAPAAMGLPARPFQYEAFPGVLVFFMAGVAAYRVAAAIDAWRQARPRLGPRTAWLGWALAAAGIFATALWLPFQHTGTNTASSTVYYAAVAVLTPIAFLLTARSRIDAFLGDLSYPLYVVHFPVVLWVAGQGAGGTARTLLVAGITAALTLLLTLAVERPLMGVRQGGFAFRLRRKPVPASVPA